MVENTLEKPGKVQAIAIMVLLNGILNILWSVIVIPSTVLGTLGLGILCVPVLILPLILGVFEIIYGVNLLSNPPKVDRPQQTLAILEILDILFLNLISLAVGIISLVFYNAPEVKEYFDSIKGVKTE